MSEEIAVRRLALAAGRFKAAKALLEAGHDADAVSRAFRAMYHAARAALGREGVTPTGMDDLVTRFRLYYVREGLVNDELASYLSRARILAEAIDEGEGVEISPVEARKITEFAGRLLAEVSGAIKRKRLDEAAEEEAGRDVTSILSNLTPEKESFLAELNEVFDGDRRMVIEFLREYGWGRINSANIRAVRSKVETREVKEALDATAPARILDGKDPYYPVKARCVFCEGPYFDAYLLRGKTMIISYEYIHPAYPLLVDSAEKPLKGYAAVDPLVLQVQVCPSCLYASANLGNFDSDSHFSKEHGLVAQLGTRRLDQLKKAVKDGEAHRRSVIQRLAETGELAEVAAVFGISRSVEAARAAFELAIISSEYEAPFNGNAFVNAGRHALSRAKLSRDLGLSHEERADLKRALDLMKRGYETSNRVAEVTYLIAVLHGELGDLQASRTHLSRIVTDRGKIPNAYRYKRWAQNLSHEIRSVLEGGKDALPPPGTYQCE